MNRRRPWLLGGLALVGGGALGGFLALRSPWVEGWIGDLLVAEIEKQTFERAKIGRAKIGFWPLGLEISDLRIEDRRTAEAIVTVEVARAGLEIRDWRVKLGRVSALRPRVRLSLDEAGRLREFRRPDDVDPPDPEERKPLTELPWGSVEVVSGALTLAFPDGEASVTDLHLAPVFGPITDIRGDIAVRYRDFSDRGAFVWPRVALGPDRIEVPAIELALRSLQLRGAASWPLGREIDATLEVRSALAEFTPLLTPPRTLDGALVIAVEGGGPIDAPEALIRVHVQDLEYTAPGRVWPTLRYRLDELSVEATASLSGVRIVSLDAREDDGHVRGTGLIERIDRGLGPRWELVESAIFVDDLSLAAALRAGGAAPNPWVDFAGDAEVHLTGPLAPLQLEGAFRTVVADFEVRQGPVDRPDSALTLGIPHATIDGWLTIYKDHLVLDGRRFVCGDNRGTVTADIGFGPQGPLDLDVRLDQADLRVLRPLGGSDLRGRGPLRGRLRGDFKTLRATGVGVMEGFAVGGVPYADRLTANIRSDMRALELTEVEATKGQTAYTGAFKMDFSKVGLPMDTRVALTDGRIEDLLGVFIDLGDLVTGRVDRADLTLSGRLNHLDGEARLDLSRVALLGEVFDRGRAAGRMHSGTFTLDDMSIRRGEGEGLTLRGSVGRAWALDMVAAGELRLETLDALRGAGVDLAGRASVLVHIDNTLFDPAPHGRLRLWQTHLAGQELLDSQLDARTTDGVLRGVGSMLGDSVALTVSAGLWGDQPYDVRLHLDELPIDRFYPVAADGQPVEIRLSGDVAISGTGGERPSPTRVLAVLPDARFAWDRHALRSDPERPWRFDALGDRWSFHDVALAGRAGTIALRAEGTAEATLVDGSGRLDADLLRAVTDRKSVV